jgi:hypothetical protein
MQWKLFLKYGPSHLPIATSILLLVYRYWVVRHLLLQVVSASDVSLPGFLTNALPEGDKPVDSGFVRECGDFFIKVNEWGALEESDIGKNRIYMCSEDGARVPDFVAELERKLAGKPGLAADVCCFLDYSFGADGSM